MTSEPRVRRRRAKSGGEGESTSAPIVLPDAQPEDSSPDRALRPRSMADYVGQASLRKQLGIYIEAARSREEALDHVLLFGPPGLGKTTLAQIIAAEMGVGLKVTSGPVLEKPGDLAVLLTQLRPRDVLFIDEIHRLSPLVEEILYPAMEDYRIDILVGEGHEARSIQVPLAPFTLVGATTRAGSLSAPLRDRFGITGRLEYYTPEELALIVTRSAGLLGIPIEPAAAYEVACRARGTPRIANRILRRVRDYAHVHRGAVGIAEVDAKAALAMLGVDGAGLDLMDRRLLSALVDFYGGGPAGLDTLAAALGEARDTLEDAVEPYLMQQGFLMRTPRGRQVTDRGRAHLQAGC